MLESQTHRKLIFGAVELGWFCSDASGGWLLVGLETGVLEWLLVVTGRSQRDFTRPAGVSDP